MIEWGTVGNGKRGIPLAEVAVVASAAILRRESRNFRAYRKGCSSAWRRAGLSRTVVHG